MSTPNPAIKLKSWQESADKFFEVLDPNIIVDAAFIKNLQDTSKTLATSIPSADVFFDALAILERRGLVHRAIEPLAPVAPVALATPPVQITCAECGCFNGGHAKLCSHRVKTAFELAFEEDARQKAEQKKRERGARQFLNDLPRPAQHETTINPGDEWARNTAEIAKRLRKNINSISMEGEQASKDAEAATHSNPVRLALNALGDTANLNRKTANEWLRKTPTRIVSQLYQQYPELKNEIDAALNRR